METPANLRSKRDYTLGFKLQIVAAVEKGDMIYKQAQAIYGMDPVPKNSPLLFTVELIDFN